MRSDADFMVYVAARWPALVKEAVLLGVRPEDAPDATVDALARCRRSWERTSREADVEALVRDQLVAAVGRRPRTDESGRERAARELLVLAPPTLEELEQEEGRRRRATLRRAVLVAVPLLLVGVGYGAYLATSGEPAPKAPRSDVLEDAAVTLVTNPAPGVVWYADGQLHLEHSVLAVDGLRNMTRIGVGVVYGDDEGRVVYVADDGSRDVLGHTDPDVPVAATDENGWAAWVETGPPGDGSSDDSPSPGDPSLDDSRDVDRLVVVEASTGNQVTSAGVPPGTRVVAVDGDSIYFENDSGVFVLQPGGTPAVSPVTPAVLLDVRSRIRAFQIDPGTIQVVQSAFDAEFDLAGQGAWLAPDGDLVATRLPGSDVVAVYSTRSGGAFESGIAPGDHVVAFAPGARLTFAYVVAPDRALPSHDLELRTCDLKTEECTVAARIPNTGGTPVLAR